MALYRKRRLYCCLRRVAVCALISAGTGTAAQDLSKPDSDFPVENGKAPSVEKASLVDALERLSATLEGLKKRSEDQSAKSDQLLTQLTAMSNIEEQIAKTLSNIDLILAAQSSRVIVISSVDHGLKSSDNMCNAILHGDKWRTLAVLGFIPAQDSAVDPNTGVVSQNRAGHVDQLVCEMKLLPPPG